MPDPTSAFTIAIAGNPNSGKTALFNLLTGTHQRIANFPGITVEKKEGEARFSDGKTFQVIDLPGTYSLDADSPDEVVAQQILLGLRRDTPAPHAVVVVVDATHLERSLFLISQLMEFGLRLVVALNMIDVARSRGIQIDVERLSQKLGLPVVPTVAIHGEGKEALLKQLQNPNDLKRSLRPFVLPASMESQRTELKEILKTAEGVAPHQADFWAGKILVGRVATYGNDAFKNLESVVTRWQQQAATTVSAAELQQSEIEERHHWCEQLFAEVVQADSGRVSISDRLDRLALHPILGPILFLAVMGFVFQAVFSWAAPAMDLIQAAISWMGQGVEKVLPDLWWRGLLVDGVIGGVGSVLVFIPQILFLSFFITLLEDTGYLARAAFLVDRLMVRSGLSGKSFVPLLSSFACAIPGIMATRTIKDERDRMATIMVAPLMTCSARLPVYALLIGAFIPAKYYLGANIQGVVLFGLYLLGILGAVVVAKVMRTTLLRGKRSLLVLELPDYKMPAWRNLVFNLMTRLKLFLMRAGKIILLASIVLWFLATYPRHPQLVSEMAKQGASESQIQAAMMKQSYAGRIGQWIEPAIAPLGYDWKMGVGLVASLAAREVFVATMGTLYNVSNAEEDSASLQLAMQSDKTSSGQILFSLPTVLSLLVFFTFAMQCVSTVAIIRRETNSWRWPIIAILYTYALAWGAAWVTFTVAHWYV